MNEPAHAPDQGHPRKWWILVAVSVGMFMALLDVTIVNIAMPRIITDLHTTVTSASWVLNAYSLVLAVSFLSMGRVGDKYGQKRVFIFGLVTFTALLAALRPRAQHRLADRLPRRPGPRRRRAADHLAGHRARRLPAAPAGHGRRPVGRSGHRRGGRRAHPGRPARDLRPLALDLLRQRADRHRRASSSRR